MTYIGVDPAFRDYGFGVAIYDDTAKHLQLMRLKGFLEFQRFFDGFDGKAVFCVENSNLQNTTFAKVRNAAMAKRLSRNAGANQAVSQLTVDWLRAKFGKGAVVELSPKVKGAKHSAAALELMCKAAGIACGSLKGEPQDALDALLLIIIAKSRLWKRK